jgi:hypothetical protein
VAVYGGKSKFEQFKELRAGSRMRAFVRAFVCAFVCVCVCLRDFCSSVCLFAVGSLVRLCGCSNGLLAWVAQMVSSRGSLKWSPRSAHSPASTNHAQHAAPPTSGAEIVIATPGRLIDLVKMKGTKLSRVTYVLTCH